MRRILVSAVAGAALTLVSVGGASAVTTHHDAHVAGSSTPVPGGGPHHNAVQVDDTPVPGSGPHHNAIQA